jgi:hypothetical protein
MSALTCANHPKETTYVRCGRCDKPICVRCMVDSPVGKKCRECARFRTHLSTAAPRQVALAFLAAVVVAVPAGAVMQHLPLLILPAFVYGYLVAQAALMAGQRSRSAAVQLATGAAALIGGIVGAGIGVLPAAPGQAPAGLFWSLDLNLFTLLNTAIGVFAAVSRVRYL